MDPVSAIVAALVAGATAASTNVASEAVRDSYAALKKVLVDTYKLVSTPLLEKKPESAAAQDAVTEEIRDNPAIHNDEAVLERAKAVQEAISALPAESKGRLGIDIERLEAGGNIIAQRIKGGIKGKDWKAAGDVTFSDVDGAGSTSGNP